MDMAQDQSDLTLCSMLHNAGELITSLSLMDFDQHSAFLSLGILSDRLFGQKRSAVGRQERNFFEAAFRVLHE